MSRNAYPKSPCRFFYTLHGLSKTSIGATGHGVAAYINVEDGKAPSKILEPTAELPNPETWELDADEMEEEFKKAMASDKITRT